MGDQRKCGVCGDDLDAMDTVLCVRCEDDADDEDAAVVKGDSGALAFYDDLHGGRVFTDEEDR